jgi:hypothetical protein
MRQASVCLGAGGKLSGQSKLREGEKIYSNHRKDKGKLRSSYQIGKWADVKQEDNLDSQQYPLY